MKFKGLMKSTIRQHETFMKPFKFNVSHEGKIYDNHNALSNGSHIDMWQMWQRWQYLITMHMGRVMQIVVLKRVIHLR